MVCICCKIRLNYCIYIYICAPNYGFLFVEMGTLKFYD